MKSSVNFFLLALAPSLVSLTGAFFANTFLRGAPRNTRDLCLIPPIPYATPEQIGARLKNVLDGYGEAIGLAMGNDPGGAVVNVVYRDTIIWNKGFGLRNMSEPGPNNTVDGNSIFRIGSITKVFTAMMMLQLRDQGTLSSLDSDVTTVLPEFKIKNPFKQKRGVTFNQLSSHMSGLPRSTPCPGMFLNGCHLPFNEIYGNLSNMELIYPPGTWPQYSNLGVAVLGRALEKIGGDSWENMLEKMILKPLQMNSTVYKVDPSMMKYLAVGYAPDGTVAKLVDIGFEAPAGQMYSTANDLSKLMMSIMNNIDSIQPHSNSLLDSETLREWMEPVYTYKDGTGYGRPWELMPAYNYTLRTKAGTINGYEAEFLMAPEIQTGVVILKSCLSCPSFGEVVDVGKAIVNVLANHLLDTDLLPPVKLPPYPEWYVGNYTGEVMPHLKVTLSVDLREVNGQKVLLGHWSGISVRLDWRSDLVQTDVFQFSGRGMSLPCDALAYGGTLGEYVQFVFQHDAGIVALMIEGVYPGVIFNKHL